MSRKFCKLFLKNAFFNFNAHNVVYKLKNQEDVWMAEMYFNYNKMMSEIDLYVNKYPFISVIGICDSILGNNIPAIILGEGETVITYIGGEEGCDSISSFLLLRFVRDICSLYEERGAAFGFSAENILKNYTLVVIPMLNPDGNIYCSECEVGALSNFLRYGYTPNILVTLSQGDECDGTVIYGEGEVENKISVALSQMSGMKRIYRESKEPRLVLCDWAMQEISSQAFSIELPQFKYSTRKQYEDKSFSYYARIRKIFFCTPFLNKIK